MIWEDKVQLAKHINNGEYAEAVEMFVNSDYLDDPQLCSMFINGSLTFYKDCPQLKEPVNQIVEKMNDSPFMEILSLRDCIRYGTLKNLLSTS